MNQVFFPTLLTFKSELCCHLEYWLKMIKKDRDFEELLGAYVKHAQTFVIKPLSNDDLVTIHQQNICIDSTYISLLEQSELDKETKIVRAMLYAVHELIHHAHHLELKPNVKAFRKVSESALMEIDLEADHWAAVFMSRVFPEWTLFALKHEQALCLKDFLVSKNHTSLARKRKALRLVSLRSDFYLMKKQGSTNPTLKGYSVVLLSKDQKHMAIMLHGLIKKQLCITKINHEQCQKILSVVDSCSVFSFEERMSDLDLFVASLF